MHWGKNIMACVQIEHSSRPPLLATHKIATHNVATHKIACVHVYTCPYMSSHVGAHSHCLSCAGQLGQNRVKRRPETDF